MKTSAGVLLYRQRATLEVLLVHPSGNYNARAPWGIPKGEPEPEEELEQTARREAFEETGLKAQELQPLGYCEYTKSRKRVYCFAGLWTRSDEPRAASWEVDRCEFVPIERARQIMHADQAVFLDRLEAMLAPEA